MSDKCEQERHRHPRANVSATATLWDERERSFCYSVEDLSAGGAFLSKGPPLPPGATVRMVLTIAGEPPVSILAKVVRQGAWASDGATLGVVFLSMTSDAKNRIRHAVLEALEGPRSSTRVAPNKVRG